MRTTGAKRTKRASRLGRFGAWLAAFALLLQVLVAVPPVQAAPVSIDQELAASICHYDPAAIPGVPAKPAHQHCQFCQLHLGAGMLLPPVGGAAPAGLPLTLVVTEPGTVAPLSPLSRHLPQSRRGPPSFS
jgi:hypothetical protein